MVDSLTTSIAEAVNRHSAESRSDTPDFVLARFLRECLQAFDQATNERTSWYACDPKADRDRIAKLEEALREQVRRWEAVENSLPTAVAPKRAIEAAIEAAKEALESVVAIRKAERLKGGDDA
jgi:hypothetical protein